MTPDPTEAPRLSNGAVVLDSGILVLREGLECILVLAAVTASFIGTHRSLRRPVAIGGVVAFAATVATWFLAAVGSWWAVAAWMVFTSLAGLVGVALVRRLRPAGQAPTFTTPGDIPQAIS